MTIQVQSNGCDLCGAEYVNGGTCREKFEECLGLEYENPQAYGTVHFLLVGCYMLQHNEYSGVVWLEMRTLVEKFLNGELTTEQIRRQFGADMDSGKRQFLITRGEKLAEFGNIQWSHTITEIRLDTAELYVEDVIHWAKSIIADTASLMDK